MEEGQRQNRSFGTLTRVEGPSIDRKEKWYIISKDIYGNGRLVDFAKGISKCFPDQIRYVHSREIHDANSQPIAAHMNYARRPSNMYITSTSVYVLAFCGKKLFRVVLLNLVSFRR